MASTTKQVQKVQNAERERIFSVIEDSIKSLLKGTNFEEKSTDETLKASYDLIATQLIKEGVILGSLKHYTVPISSQYIYNKSYDIADELIRAAHAKFSEYKGMLSR